MSIAFRISSFVFLGALCTFAAEQDGVRMLAAGPLRFEPANRSADRFVARGLHYGFAFSRNEAVLRSNGETVRLTFEGASRTASVSGAGQLRSTTNILVGNDPTQWRTMVPNYGRLEVNGLYPGIDAVYYGNGSVLEYDLVVKPGADPRSVRLRFSGVRPHIDRHGDLLAGFVQKRPDAYQLDARGERVAVTSRYLRRSDGTFAILLGEYDRSRDVIIDPQLKLSTYFTGSQQDIGTSIGHDALGYVYVAGTTRSPDLTSYGIPAVGSLAGTSNVFIAKLDPHVTPDRKLVYFSYVGGTAADTLSDMVVTPNGRVYLTGSTTSNNFPNINAAQTLLTGTVNAFVMQLDLSQSSPILYSTYFGGTGTDVANAIAVGSNSRVFIAGTAQSMDLTIANGAQTTNGSNQTAFVAGFDLSQSGAGSLIYSSYIGGAGGEEGRGVAVASDGTVWVGGGTFSSDFPISGFSYQPVYQPGGDGFVAQFNPSLSGVASLVYASFLSGTHSDGPDEIKKIAIDSAGRLVLTGYTGSSDFPTTGASVLQPLYGGNFDAFITIMDPRVTSSRNEQLVYSTFYGGSGADIPYDLKLDAAGNIYVAGFTISKNLPVSVNALQPSYNAKNPTTINGFALKFTTARPSIGGLGYSSYIASVGRQIAYGIDYDTSGNIYVTGYTTADLFGSLGGIPKTSASGKTDAFLMGITP